MAFMMVSTGTCPHQLSLLKCNLPACIDKHYNKDTRKSTSIWTGNKNLAKKVNKHGLVFTSPTEAAVIASEPLTKQDLVGLLSSGCKPKEQWRLGTEHEKIGFDLETLLPISYKQIAELLNHLGDRFGWEKVMVDGNVIALKQGVTLEPGGQLELSGVPLKTLHQTYAEIKSHLNQVDEVGKELGIGFSGLGLQPKWQLKDIPMMPMERSDILKRFLLTVGSFGREVMLMTCSVQVNLDYSSELDMIRKFRASLALQPLATAIFANSPFTGGNPNGYLSKRSHFLSDFANDRSGMLPFVFDNSFGFERYVEYALDVPMICVLRRKKFIDCAGMSFRDFMEGKLPQLPGEYPTLNDWENHLSSLYPEVRMKKYLELRGADSGPLSMLCALPAFWVGLLYDEVSLQNVLDLIDDWTSEERDMLRNEVPKYGLKTPFRDGWLRDVAEDVFKWSKDGLRRRGLEEVQFLDPLAEIVRTGVTPAEKLLEKYHGQWGKRVDPIFQEQLLF